MTGLADLGLGQVGGLRDHLGLAGDGFGHRRGAAVQGGGEAGHGLAFMGQLVAQGVGRACRTLGRQGELLGLLGQDMAEIEQFGAGAGGGRGGGLDLHADALDRRSGLGHGDGGRLQHVRGHGLGAHHLGREPRALAYAIGGDPEEADGRHRQHDEDRRLIGLELHRPDRPLVADSIDRQGRPQQRRQKGGQIQGLAERGRFGGDEPGLGPQPSGRGGLGRCGQLLRRGSERTQGLRREGGNV